MPRFFRHFSDPLDEILATVLDRVRIAVCERRFGLFRRTDGADRLRTEGLDPLTQQQPDPAGGAQDDP
jgi:hypothetical protein